MNSSDFRLVKLIPITGNGSVSRASDATYWDKNGVLQTAPPNTLRVTYDPSDLSKAPYALIEPAATNYAQNNTMAGAVLGTPGTLPTGWSAATTVNGVTRSIVGVGIEDGIAYLDIGFSGTATGNAGFYPNVASAAASAGQNWQIGAFAKLLSGQRPSICALVISGRRSDGGAAEDGPAIPLPEGGLLRESFMVSARDFTSADTVSALSFLNIGFNTGTVANCVVRIGLPQMCRDWVSKCPIKTSNGTATRAADLVGAGAGLLYSSVPITEPLWAAGTTYAAKAQVRDAANIVYESLVASNIGNDPMLPASSSKWLKLGATNRWKAFDKAVNSQTVGQGPLTFTVKPGTLANTLMLLNVEGATVTVSEAQSGYSRTKQLVRHDVRNWYDFYFQEPIRDGDVVFEDVPPNPNAVVTVTVDNGSSDARMGCCLVGKYRSIGKTASSLTAGVLSYSTSTTDIFGNVTMVRRPGAKRQNFDVHIPAGFEDEAYRLLMQCTDVEIGVIAGDRYSMGIGYGYLGQWSVPVSRGGKAASIEFKGLV